MFKLFKDDEKCPVCNKNMNDLVEGKIFCEPCLDESIEKAAKRGIFRHIFEAGICLFNFDFMGMIVELKWAIDRTFGIGDYNKKTGEFYVKGYLKK